LYSRGGAGPDGAGGARAEPRQAGGAWALGYTAAMHSGQDSTRAEIAAAAARLVADGGLDYGAAKTRAARDLFGQRVPRGVMPDNDEIDEALREHLALFDAAHPQRVAQLRSAALALMDQLADFSPLVTGAAWKGIAAEHAPIHLQLFHDNLKEVEYWLLDRRIAFEVGTIAHFAGTGEEVEAISFLWNDLPVLLSLYDPRALRGALRGGEDAQRGAAAALRARIARAAAETEAGAAEASSAETPTAGAAGAPVDADSGAASDARERGVRS